VDYNKCDAQRSESGDYSTAPLRSPVAWLITFRPVQFEGIREFFGFLVNLRYFVEARKINAAVGYK
jgi:hypothetical protein